MSGYNDLLNNSFSCNSAHLARNSYRPPRISCVIGNTFKFVRTSDQNGLYIVRAGYVGSICIPESSNENNIAHGFSSLVKRLADFFCFVSHKIAQNRTNGRKARGAGW